MTRRLLLLGACSLLCAATPCDVREKELYVEALTSRGGVALWKAESNLIKHRRPEDCVEAPPPATGASPGAITVEVDLPRTPEGAGAGPWVFLGVGLVLAGGAAVVDVLANDARDELEQTQASGDREGFSSARDDLIVHQWVARGFAAGAAVSAVTGLLWLALGGEDVAVQTRPVFTGRTAGVEVRF